MVSREYEAGFLVLLRPSIQIHWIAPWDTASPLPQLFQHAVNTALHTTPHTNASWSQGTNVVTFVPSLNMAARLCFSFETQNVIQRRGLTLSPTHRLLTRPLSAVRQLHSRYNTSYPPHLMAFRAPVTRTHAWHSSFLLPYTNKIIYLKFT
jgi:hypothetical protein